jgi:hypothetical protein
MVIGAFVRGLSMRDIESLCEKAGLGKLSKTTASRICEELRERFEQFKPRDLYDVGLVVLFVDAVLLSVRRDGPKEGVLVAWGFREQGERVLLSVMLDARVARGLARTRRDVIAGGLGAPLLVVADGAVAIPFPGVGRLAADVAVKETAQLVGSAKQRLLGSDDHQIRFERTGGKDRVRVPGRESQQKRSRTSTNPASSPLPRSAPA